MRRRYPWVLAGVFVVACSSGDAGEKSKKTGDTPPPVDVTITLAPETATVGANGAALFTATVAGAADTAVVWSVEEGAAGGTIQNGNYLAPAALGTYHVVAAAAADATKSAKATVTVVAAKVTGLTPAKGAAGDTITLSGSFFGAVQGASTVTLGGAPATIVQWSDTAVGFLVPGGTGVGPFDVALTVAEQAPITKSLTVVPGITALAPVSAATGRPVAIAGTNFGATQGASTITVGGAAATVTAWAATGATFTVPVAAPGGAQNVVVTVGGYASAPRALQVVALPSIAALSAASAGVGAPITITGAHFGAAKGASQVWFGDLTAATTAWADGAITALVPPAALPATVPVFVVVGGLATNRVPFVPLRPWVSGRSPAAGTTATTVTLRGANFGAAAGTVTVGGVAAATSGWYPAVVTFAVPAGVAQGRQRVQLTDAAGRAANAVTLNLTGHDVWVLPDMPLARMASFAVWTGNEMLVWGGQPNLSNALATGGRYNPATDTWLPMATQNAPAPRTAHEEGGYANWRVAAPAVWTGEEMIVWGGLANTGGYTALNTGGRYNPLTDTWAPMSAVNAPAARKEVTGVWSGRELLVWGGDDPGTGYTVDSGARYNPRTDAWAALGTTGAPTGRNDAPAVWTGTEMITWGNQSNGVDDVGGRYDAASDTWVKLPAYLPLIYRNRVAAAWTGAYFVVWGGNAGVTPVATGGRYDPQTDTWSAMSTAGAPGARQRPIALAAGGKLLVWGGSDYGDGVFYSDGGQYDAALDAWGPIASAGAPAPRSGAAAVYTGRELLVWGGRDGSYGSAQGGRYDPAANAWVRLGDGVVPILRASTSLVWTGSEMILWGGQYAGTVTGSATGARYNPATDTWVPTSTVGAPLPRYEHAAVWIGSEMLVWGGWYSPNGSNLYAQNTGGKYNPATDAWTAMSTAGNVASARLTPSLVWTGTEVLIWGNAKNGSDGRYYPAGDTWSTFMAIPAGDTSFTARSGFNAVWTGSKAIYFGGIDNVYQTGQAALSSYMYTEASATWTQFTYLVANAPARRGHASAVWTGTEMVVWGGETYTYGGGCGCWYTLAYADGARFNPATVTWSALSSTGAPAARRKAHAGYSAGKFFVWAGTDANDQPFADGGVYDLTGNTWSQLSTVNAPDVLVDQNDVWAGDRLIVWPGGAYLP